MDPVCAFGHLAPGGVDCSGNGICVNITGRSTCQCNEGWAGTGDFTFVAEDCVRICMKSYQFTSLACGRHQSKQATSLQLADCQTSRRVSNTLLMFRISYWLRFEYCGASHHSIIVFYALPPWSMLEMLSCRSVNVTRCSPSFS